MGRNHAGRHQEEGRNEQGMGFDWMRSAETMTLPCNGGTGQRRPRQGESNRISDWFLAVSGSRALFSPSKTCKSCGKPPQNPLKTPYMQKPPCTETPLQMPSSACIRGLRASVSVSCGWLCSRQAGGVCWADEDGWKK